MTTTVRPTGPLRQEGGVTSRGYDVCVNGRPVGTIELGTDPEPGPTVGVIRSLRIDEPDRRRGRATVAVLAAEEVLRDWGCTRASMTVPSDAVGALRLAEVTGYTERRLIMVKELPAEPPVLPAGLAARPMTDEEFDAWWAVGSDSLVRDWMARGTSAEQARALSEVKLRQALPAGRATPGVTLSVLTEGDRSLGYVCVGQGEVRPGAEGALVWDVRVEEPERGRGFGRALMLVAERAALESGRTLLGLARVRGQHPRDQVVRVAPFPDDGPRVVQGTLTGPLRVRRGPAGGRSAVPRWARAGALRSGVPGSVSQQPVRDLLHLLAHPLLPLAAVQPLTADDIGGRAGHADRLALGLVGVDDQGVPAVDESSVELLGVQVQLSRDLQQERLSLGGERLGAAEHGLRVSPAPPLFRGLLGGLRGGEGMPVVVQREVAEPQFDTASVTSAQRPEIRDRPAAVGALEVAPHVDDDGTGGGE